MHALTALVLAAAGLLALAGAFKLVRPAGTVQALRTQGLPSAPLLVRALGLVELAVAGAAALQVPGGVLALAALYAGFTGFVAVALVRGRPLSSCGCFAEPDLPPTWAHVGVTGGLAVAAALAVGDSGLPALASASVGTGLATLAAAALVGWLAYLVLAELPRTLAEARRPDEAAPDGPRLFTLTPVRSSAP